MSLFGGVELASRPDLSNIARLDRLPIPMIRRMQRYGIAYDIPYSQDLSSQFGSRMGELSKDISSYIPSWALDQFVGRSTEIEESEGDASINANSAEQISDLLFNVLRVGAGKQLKTTAGGKRISTGKKQLELLRNDHPIVPLILQYREYAKLKNTYTDSLPLLAKLHPRNNNRSCPVCELSHIDDTWRVHTEFPTTRAATGRLASRNPNLQNIPARTELGRMVRKGFIAGKGKRLQSTDFSQIELRDAAHCAKAKSMIDVYQQGKDIHIYTACRAFNLDYDEYSALDKIKKKLEGRQKKKWDDFALNCRMPSKNLNFMIVYGAMAKGLQAQLALSGLFWTKEECEQFINRWFELYPEMREYMDLQAYRVRRYGYGWDLLGRIRLCPELSSTHSWISAAGIRQAGNLPIQSVAAGQMKLAMGELDPLLTDLLDSGVWVWPLLSIHDELITEVEEGRDVPDMVRELTEMVFSGVMTDRDTGEDLWRVPIGSDGKVMERWVKD